MSRRRSRRIQGFAREKREAAAAARVRIRPDLYVISSSSSGSSSRSNSRLQFVFHQYRRIRVGEAVVLFSGLRGRNEKLPPLHG